MEFAHDLLVGVPLSIGVLCQRYIDQQIKYGISYTLIEKSETLKIYFTCSCDCKTQDIVAKNAVLRSRDEREMTLNEQSKVL